MDVVDPQVMQRVFEVTDDLGIHRESIQVPLAMEGDGSVHRLPNDKWEIRLPARDGLDGFLADLPGRLGADPDDAA